MKKSLLIILGLFLFVGYVDAKDASVLKTDVPTSYEQRSVVFRSTQIMRASDGCEIYFFSNRICKMYDSNGRLMVTCTYRLANGEAYLLDENGNDVYKGAYRMSSDGRNLTWVKFAGVIYYKR